MKLENRKLTIEAGDEYGHYKFNGVDKISGKSATLEFDNCILLTDGDIITEDLLDNLRTLCQLEKGDYSEVNAQYVFMKYTDNDELIPVQGIQLDYKNTEEENIFLRVDSVGDVCEIGIHNSNGIIGETIQLQEVIH